jgi:hypothetical protein
MIRSYLRALFGVALMLAWVNLAQAQSTINTAMPATSSDLTSLVVRQQFLAAANDINGLLSKHAATSVGQCPATPFPGEDCITIGSTPYGLNIWSGGAAGWTQWATLNPTTGVVTVPLNASDIVGSKPVVVTFPSGVATVALSFNSSLVMDGSNNLGINLANPNTFTATQSFPAGSITNAELANSTISGIALGGTLPTLTFGTHVTGTSYNGSAAITLGLDATNLDTVSTIVARDASGNFSAGTITASLTGHASLDLALSSLGTGVQTALGTALNASGGLASSASPTLSGTISGSPTFSGTVNHTGTFEIGGVAQTFPPSGLLAGTTDTQSLTHTSLTASTDVLGGVTTTLGSDATGDLYCRNSSGLLSRIGIGAASTLLTSGGAGVCPTWAAAPGGGNVSSSGTPTANQFALWTSSTQIEGVNAAAKSDQQTATSAILPVTPSQQQSHPSAAKAWVQYTETTGAILAGYNVTSVTHNSAGNDTINFAIPFATANYVCNVTGQGNTTFGSISNSPAPTASSITVLYVNGSGAGTNPVNGHVTCFGSQ